MTVRTEIDEEARAGIAESLSRLLADTYTLYLKTQNYHWNVQGPQFHALHTMFEQHYVEMRDAVDRIAERIRALGFPAPGSYSEYSRLTMIDEAAPGIADASDMIQALAGGHEIVAGTARAAVNVAEAGGDIATADLATGRVEVHEKTAWMLRAMAA